MDQSTVETISRYLEETPALREKRLRAFSALMEMSEAARASTVIPSLPPVPGDHIHPDRLGKQFGVIAIPFTELDRGMPVMHQALFTTLFGSLLDTENPQHLAHHALLTQGLFLYVSPGTRVTEPLRLLVTDGQHWTATHIVVVVGRGSSATIMEELLPAPNGVDPASPAFWSHATEIFLEEDAKLEYVSLQAAGSGKQMHMMHRSRIGAGAHLTWRNATLGGHLVEHGLRAEVMGVGGTSDIDWLFYAAQQERQTLSVRNTFNAREGGGEITMKGIAQEKAHAAARGMIAIGPQGGGTNTYLTQSVLMLDPTAKVDAVPGLEIKTNDVKASHSAGITRVSAEDLFYFAARGIAERDARRMYIEGFLGDLAGRISDVHHREYVRSAIERKYGEA